MLSEEKYMDDAFKKASDEVKFPYQSAFWNDVESQLADDSLDHAFKSAAGKSAFVPPFEMPADLNVDDVFMDEAFKSAGESTIVNYKPEFFEQFQSNLGAIQQDEAFVAAANNVKTDYRPHYWSAADVALQEEGLHYEYKKDYWTEARGLLDKADRRLFFLKWSSVAVVLLLLSVAGIYSGNDALFAEGTRAGNHGQFVAHQVQNAESNNQAVGDLDNVGSNSHSVQHDAGSDLTAVNTNVVATNEIPVINLPEPTMVERTTTVDGSNGVNSAEPITSDLTGSPTIGTDPLTGTDPLIAQPEVNSTPLTLTNPLINSSEPTIVLNEGEKVISDFSSLVKLPGVGEVEVIDNHRDPIFDMEEVKISKDGYLASLHSVSFFSQAGVGNKYNSALAKDFLPAWRGNVGFEYMNTSFGRLRNFEFGGSLGMNYIRQTDFGLNERSTVHELSGDVNHYFRKVQLKDLFYGSATAIVAYRIYESPKLQHKIKLGFSYDHLALVRSNMIYNNDENEEIVAVNNNWGVTEGLNNFDLRLSFGYELKLGQHFAFQVNGSYGLMDRTDNAFVGNDLSDHETNVTAGFKYTIFRK